MTGAGGFVGRVLVGSLDRSGHSVLAVARGNGSSMLHGVRALLIPDIREANWADMLQGVDAVIHLAARAHIINERASDPLAEFRSINSRPAVDLYRACQDAAVERFVFVSSIGVNGTFTTGVPFTEEDAANPTEPYAVSKWEAEQLLRAQFRRDSTGLTIVRPALIYGPQAKGNFERLMRLVNSGLPLPFGAMRGKRSFLGLSAFCDLLEKCLVRSSRDVQLYLAADNRPVTTSEIVSALAAALGKHRKQWRVPIAFLSLAAKSVNRTTELKRLTESLEVNPSLAQRTLGWSSDAMGADLSAMAETFLRTRNAG